MVRLDKFLCDCQMGTRSQVKVWIRQGLVTVNGKEIRRPEEKIEEGSEVICRNRRCSFSRNVCYLLHKPAGVVSAVTDHTADTVLSLLNGVPGKNLFPIGRLDKDTTGLLLITDDGELAHRLTSPGRHVDKVYEVSLRCPLTRENIRRLETGVEIGEGEITLPARVEMVEDLRMRLTIREGKFHQIKRMLLAVGNEVTALKRIAYGPLVMEQELLPGQFRELREEELKALRECVGL